MKIRCATKYWCWDFHSSHATGPQQSLKITFLVFRSDFFIWSIASICRTLYNTSIKGCTIGDIIQFRLINGPFKALLWSMMICYKTLKMEYTFWQHFRHKLFPISFLKTFYTLPQESHWAKFRKVSHTSTSKQSNVKKFTERKLRQNHPRNSLRFDKPLRFSTSVTLILPPSLIKGFQLRV